MIINNIGNEFVILINLRGINFIPHSLYIQFRNRLINDYYNRFDPKWSMSRRNRNKYFKYRIKINKKFWELYT
jgi:hypothetical protein